MLMRKCPSCRAYTLRARCGKCRVETRSVGPPRFSPQDRYGAYRRRMKKEMEKDGKR